LGPFLGKNPSTLEGGKDIIKAHGRVNGGYKDCRVCSFSAPQKARREQYKKNPIFFLSNLLRYFLIIFSYSRNYVQRMLSHYALFSFSYCALLFFYVPRSKGG
jgi:hypothetical protein